MRPSLAQLEALLWIHRLGGFRAAARRLGVTQPALSQRIAELERAVGAPVLQRSRAAPQPTATGRDLLVYAERMVALAEEMHPHTAHHVVQTLRHLLPCAPREVFLVAARAITSSSAAGYQHESLAVSEVVKLIQSALADHREIFHSADNTESDCLVALLKVLDLFVEAGWAEARQLTHRLEEIYR